MNAVSFNSTYVSLFSLVAEWHYWGGSIISLQLGSVSLVAGRRVLIHGLSISCYVLIDWVGGPDKKIFGPMSWRTDRAQRSQCAMNEGQIFSRPARPNSVNKHFIIWPPRFSFFLFFICLFFIFRVIKFVMLTYVALFDRKVGIYIATKLF